MSSPIVISVAPDREVVDRAAVIRGIDDGGRFGGEAGEILARRQSGDVDVGRQERLQRDRRRELAGADQAARDVEDLRMDRLEEMLRLEKIGDAIKRLVIDEDRAQQRLLRLDIVRCGAIGRRGFAGPLARSRFEGCHDAGANRLVISSKRRALTAPTEFARLRRLCLCRLPPIYTPSTEKMPVWLSTVQALVCSSTPRTTLRPVAWQPAAAFEHMQPGLLSRAT